MLETQKQVEAYVETIRKVDATLDPASDGWAKRKRLYNAIGRELLEEEDSICQQMGRMMASFKKGLFAGGGRGDFRATTWIWSVGFAYPKGTSVAFTDAVTQECASCRKARRCCWPGRASASPAAIHRRRASPLS